MSNTVSATLRPDIVNLQRASSGGRATHEVIQIIQIFEKHRIICCLVGVSALVFYGAERIQHDWEICIPSDRVKDAVSLLSNEFVSMYTPAQRRLPQPASLSHTYPRFSGKDADFSFILVPSHDAHIRCSESTIQRSNGLPYPTLPVLIQSFLDTNNTVALCDVVDGTNVSECWGRQHLKLDGTNDIGWAKRMNGQIYSDKDGPMAWVSLFPTAIVSKQQMWESGVRNKKSRLGWTQPEELFETRFRLKSSDNPRNITHF
ncbi:uncharacterized protein BDZ99DRAFT_392496 [Mytilinidion resinicola]|uniref:Uncharacterized protein n=1 Tax=Mytilinidion resinicola TaxID=574789 RepID=A0A6A6YFJ7_9PEZI|nr:uncharacterized protein BDZ99DRAFT_392496 [Mytilinidion resinicola]KAF2807510.1 hypothetical protein BDZ99DRAFT_392496 [Mytilinidion resinicola]